MNDAELYQRSNTLQTRDALQCLEEYAMKINWQSNRETIIDIGCGDGSVTTNILKKYLPCDGSKLIGCDKSEKMVEFANKHYGHDNTSFMVLDIEDDLPPQLKGKFNHVFSFYALHWVKQQETAFSNIYDLLTDRGDCLLVFLGHTPIYDVFRTLSQSKPWNYWLRNIDSFISPYHDSMNPEKEIRRMMTNIGFKNVEVTCSNRTFAFENTEVIKRAVAAINPFEIPKNICDDFLEDYIKIVKEKYIANSDNNNAKGFLNISTNYQLIIAYGKK